jgi:hypothetical protein
MVKRLGYYVLALGLLAPLTAVGADARTEYYQRAAERDMTSFRALDVDQNRAVTRAEIQGDLDFGPRFDDMDINRDGVVTMEELQRYLEFHYGVASGAAKT